MLKKDAVASRLSKYCIRTDVCGCDCTSFRIGGALSLFMEADSVEAVVSAINAARENDYPVYILGNGSNMLISDRGIDALFVRIGRGLSTIKFSGRTAVVGCGALLSTVAKTAVNCGLMGLEWASGIPGTVGGGIAMNAGAYGGEMKQRLRSVTVLIGDRVESLCVADSDMGYRRSRFAYPDMITFSAMIELEPDDGFARFRMEEFTARRKDKQPINLPSAGSTFKRPEGYYAGALIEGAGLKGRSVGGACVSTKHAGFIVNRGGATFDDVVRLIDIVREEVLKKFGVELEPEVKILG